MARFENQNQQLEEAYEKFRKGKMTLENLLGHVSVSKIAHARVCTDIRMAEMKYSRPSVYDQLKRKGVVDDSTVVWTNPDARLEPIICPIKGMMVREDCMNRMDAHPEECEGCEIGAETKEKLLDKEPYVPPRD